jgi:hypothetical protein
MNNATVCANCGKDLPAPNPFLIGSDYFRVCQHCQHPNPTVSVADLPDYKLRIASRIERSYAGIRADAVLSDPVSAFITNMDSVVSLGAFLSWANITIVQFSLWCSHIFNTTPEDTDGQIIVGKLREVMANRNFTLPPGPRTAALFLGASFVSMDGLLGWRGTVGAGMGARAILSSMIVASWTAFESLSSDLWIAAVNAFPNPLAVNVGQSPSKPPREMEKDKKSQEKSFTVSKMHEYDRNFNLSAVMGNLLAEEKKVEFTSLGSTATAYEAAFGKPLNLFEDDQLRLLEIVRNLIVHDGGKVNDEFMGKTKKANLQNHADCTEAKVGDLLPLNGEMVKRFADCSAKAGTELIRFVDRYLQHLREKIK